MEFRIIPRGVYSSRDVTVYGYKYLHTICRKSNRIRAITLATMIVLANVNRMITTSRFHKLVAKVMVTKTIMIIKLVGIRNNHHTDKNKKDDRSKNSNTIKITVLIVTVLMTMLIRMAITRRRSVINSTLYVCVYICTHTYSAFTYLFCLFISFLVYTFSSLCGSEARRHVRSLANRLERARVSLRLAPILANQSKQTANSF